MAARHAKDHVWIAGEGILSLDGDGNPKLTAADELDEIREFRFTRLIPGLKANAENRAQLLAKLSLAMIEAKGKTDPSMPAGFTYLGQFVDHDLTFDDTSLSPSAPVTIDDLISGRSPALDLDSLYAKGPEKSPEFYSGPKLKVGRPAPSGQPVAEQDGLDLPRRLNGTDKREQRRANIPDRRNDENLAVAQIHAAFIRFHNTVVDDLQREGVPSAVLFETARELVVKHYQWMLREDYLPRICDPAVVNDVFKKGRRVFDVTTHEAHARMPVEFSGAAFRLGHSMIREEYRWNSIFEVPGDAARSGNLFRLFRFSGLSGNLSPTPFLPGSPEDLADLEANEGDFVQLPSVWVADWRRLFDLNESGRNDLDAPAGKANRAMAIDTTLVDPLKNLPRVIGGGDALILKNLAFRNLLRGRGYLLPSGQQLVAAFADKGVEVRPLTQQEIFDGNGGAKLDQTFTQQDKDELATNTPLWFYVLREAELNNNKLAGVGARIVAETFHRCMQASRYSIISDQAFRPQLPRGQATASFKMAHLLVYAFGGDANLLAPVR